MALRFLLDSPDAGSVPIRALRKNDLPRFLSEAAPAVKRWLESTRFEIEAGKHRMVPGGDGSLGEVLLGLASMIRDAGFPVRLRVLVPAVENSVSGSALRPLDVVRSRKGTTIEIGNTDAEGRVILADALTEASRENPALLLDFATLTGAARVALGADLPALFCNDEDVARVLLSKSESESDPLWRMPLFKPYRKQIESKVADLTNSTDSPLAGAITAALFLQEFIDPGIPWAHVDLMAWNQTSRPGRPEGGEAMGMRAAFALVEEKFS